MLSSRAASKIPRRRDNHVIIHFDYDCFYASVFEAENPALKSLPLAVQQKHIVVTCNYVARERGLRKLQLITEAKKLCPDAIIVLGEDLTRFRNASKLLYNFIRKFSWNDKVERLGFDEVWMDVTDIIDYNVEVLNKNNLANSFFHLSPTDPTLGFAFDASNAAGHTYPPDVAQVQKHEIYLRLRLVLGSHLAFHIRRQLEEHNGYTSTVGISTSKMLSKLAGNVHKPKSQTTLMPPYQPAEQGLSTVQIFINDHDIGKVPWIGFKLAQKLREYVLNRPASFQAGVVYGPTRENVTVKHVREIPNLSAEVLEKILSGPGSPHGIGAKVWALIHGVDDTEVSPARSVPRQISIEDSYVRLDTMDQALSQMTSLTTRLLERMRTDLTDIDDNNDAQPAEDLQTGKPLAGVGTKLKYIAHPNTLRLSTRPRPPLNADGTRSRTFKRISRSCPLPSFVFSLSIPAAELADRLVRETVVPLFRKLHPEKSGWNLSLVNVAVTGMEDGERAQGGDIGSIFKRNGTVDEMAIKQDLDMEMDDPEIADHNDMAIEDDALNTSNDYPPITNGCLTPKQLKGNSHDISDWYDNTDDEDDTTEDRDGDYICPLCHTRVPRFAKSAHDRFHTLEA